MNTRVPSLGFALLLGLSTLAQAETPAPAGAAGPAPEVTGSAPPYQRMRAGMDPEGMTEHMRSSLGLSEAQTKEVADINRHFTEQAQALRERAEKERQQRMETMRTLGTERDAALKKVLDEKQYAQHLAQQQNNRARMRQHRGMGPGMGGPRPPVEGGAATPAPQ